MRRWVESALDGARLERALSNKEVTVLVPDATRPLSAADALAPLCTRLAEAGARLRLVVALGLHRRMRPEERAPLEAVARSTGARLEEHDPGEGGPWIAVGPPVPTLPGLPPLQPRYRPSVAQSDALVVAGVVEPHQYAGYSGGVKALAIGCAPRAAIGFLHGLHYLRHPGVALGAIADNPFQEVLWRLVAALPPIHALMLVPGQAAFAGSAEDSFGAAVELARHTMFEAWPEPLPLLHLPVPAAKAQSFYQASRAATYVALARRPAVTPGGALILEAACPEGIGEGEGERACAKAMARGARALIAELSRPLEGPAPLSGGEQRAYMLARALQVARIALVGAPPMAELQAMGILQADSVDQARALLGEHAEPVTVPDAFSRVPYVR